MLLRQAGPGGVHVHAAQAGQGRVVELLLHAGQRVSLPLHREQDGWGRVHVGGAILPGHQVDDAGHGWGAEGAKGFVRGAGQPDTLPRGDTGAPVWWQGHSDNVTDTQRTC